MELSAGVGTIVLFGAMFVLLATGLPVVFVLGGIAISFTILIYGFDATLGLYLSTWDTFTSQMLLAIPLFLFMASVLQHSGIADDAYDMFHKWMGGLNGGLAMGTVLICTIFAAITGTSGAATVSMGLIAIPSMLKRGYNKHLVTGGVAAGGVLGILIPPSIIMILYSLIAHLSVGRMFMGGILPGLVASFLYCLYIGIRCWRNPKLGPALPVEERATWGAKLVSLRALILPLLLIVAVLGSIWFGIATPTEAAAVGAFGAFISAAIHRRLNWTLLKTTTLPTLKLCAMVFWIVAGAFAFSNLYTQMGARGLIEDIMTGLEVNRWVIMAFIQFSILVLGCLMDDFAIIMLTSPIYLPIINVLGFDPLWYGILFIVNMNIAYLTPPFGYNLFYLRGLGPYIKEQTGQDLTMVDLYRSVIPFIGLQIIVLALVMIFPMLATWLPSMMFG